MVCRDTIFNVIKETVYDVVKPNPGVDNLLLEDGSNLLLEDGGVLVLEE